ncbi:hypothetical protein ACP70R_007823 [Stipagrostis hirtigluma subsp. patula]
MNKIRDKDLDILAQYNLKGYAEVEVDEDEMVVGY